ncbi:MAG: glycosyltransferase [Candidatus Omnitrophica bacterium]|nr:glycosyltransferase [Candidatus Omnitrophota bacterium]
MSDQKIKVLHIIKTLGLGGAEVNLLNLLSFMDQRQFELHVAYSYGGELEPKFLEAGIKLCKYAEKDHKVKSFATVGIVARLVEYIRKHKIQIVHTHTFSAHIWGAAAAKLTGCRIVEHVHDFRYLEPEDFVRRRGFNNQYKFIKYFKNVSDRVVVLTRQNQEFLLQEGIYPLSRIREYQNGIPLTSVPAHPGRKERDAILQEFGLDKNALIVLTPIRVAPEKNADLVIRIAAQVVKRVPNAVFLIAGDGPLFQEVSQEIEKRNLTANVKLIGYYAQIGRLLEGADIFLLPSFLELHSIAILEAMSKAVAVVISKDVGCNSEFIRDWENGILLDPFADDGWAEAIVALCENENLRRKIGEAGLATCREKFDIKDAAARFVDLYQDLVKR